MMVWAASFCRPSKLVNETVKDTASVDLICRISGSPYKPSLSQCSFPNTQDYRPQHLQWADISSFRIT
uniref:Uncharacterized protein n=1 Tax=Arundo donax TaxID=35708 RepID=A0A0A9EEY7_ARUDO